MADHPMIFSGPMVLALLEGRKTQTRRVLKPLPNRTIFFNPKTAGLNQHKGPRFAVGDRLWVREHWKSDIVYDDVAPRDMRPRTPVHYEADGSWRFSVSGRGRFRQSMHMPRWASRLTLVVEGVKVERLQDISDADALAEGIAPHPSGLGYWVPGIEHPDPNFPWLSRTTPREMYAALWDTINGSGAWGENPWVVAYTFRVVHANIDKIGGGHV